MDGLGIIDDETILSNEYLRVYTSFNDPAQSIPVHIGANWRVSLDGISSEYTQLVGWVEYIGEPHAQ